MNNECKLFELCLSPPKQHSPQMRSFLWLRWFEAQWFNSMEETSQKDDESYLTLSYRSSDEYLNLSCMENPGQG